MHQLLGTTTATTTTTTNNNNNNTRTKPCVTRGRPSCIRGFVRDRCRKCTMGSNACAMCHNHNYNHGSTSSPTSLPSSGVKSGNNKLELQQRLERLSYNAPSIPISHVPQPRRSFDFQPLFSTSDLETSSSSSKGSSPRQSLLVEEVKENESGIKDRTALAIPNSSSPFVTTPTALASQNPSSPTATLTLTPAILGSTSPLSPSSTGLPWTSPPSFSKSSGGSASCILCFNGRQVCEDCFGLGYVQRICQDCFKDQKHQQQQQQQQEQQQQQQQSSLSPRQQRPRLRHGASLSLPSVSRPSVSTLSSSPTSSPSSSASTALSLPWSGLGSRLKEQRWLSGLNLSMGGLTSPSTDSGASSATWTEVLSPVTKEVETDLLPSSPSSYSCNEQAPLRRRQRDRTSIVWAEDVNDPPQTPRTPKWSASFSSSGMDAKNQGKEDDDDFDDFEVDGAVFGSNKSLPRSISTITRAARSSSWSSSSPSSALSSPSFKTVVLKHLKAPGTLFKTGQEVVTDNSDSTAGNNEPPLLQESERRPDGDRRKRWSVGLANIGQSWVPSTRLGVSTVREARQQEEGQEGLVLSSSGSSSIQEERRSKRGHRRYWSLSVISPNNLFGASSTAA